MKLKINIKILALSFLSLFGIWDESTAQEVFRSFATRDVHHRLVKEYDQYQRNQQDIEEFTEEFRSTKNPKKVQVPVVFHVLYAKPSERLSDEQIISQIEALNRDFGKKDYKVRHRADVLQGFSKKADDMLVEFCLAAETPDGEKTEGITYTAITQEAWTEYDSMKLTELGGVDAWNPNQYLNVWICNLTRSSGYAQLPGGPLLTDGIVIDYQFVGIGGTAKHPYDEGKTLTHLVGNYLNLLPLWGFSRCEDDKVSDTPIHNSPNLRCPGYKHLSTCNGIPVEMTMNFMDNTYDACMYMFTSGQKMRMQAVLAEGGPRYGLTQGKVKCKKNPQPSPQSLADFLSPDDPEEGLAAIRMKVHPNPARQEAFYNIYSPKAGLAEIQVFDAGGALFYRQTIELIQGRQEIRVDCKHWHSGLYLFALSSEGKMQSQRLMLVNDQ